MSTVEQQQLAVDVTHEDQVVRKVFNRVVPFLFVLMVIAYLDRVNMGFAALSMNKELRLTATMYGFANSLFYVGYAACEIPSNLMLVRVGARKWIGRIMITWGLASCACMFAAGANSLYGLRTVVGLAEAGFMPGTLLYLTYWFPPTFRARVTALFLLAQPLTFAVGASVSGVILEHANGIWGLSGWRWLFLIEGFPAILLGIVTLFYLTDRPAQAKWLTEGEKAALERRLRREQNPRPEHGKIWREVLSRDMLLLSVMYFGIVTGLGAMVGWTPQIMREMLKSHGLTFVGVLTAIPGVCAIVCTLIWGAHSDRKMERSYHFMLPMALATFGSVLVAFSNAPEVRMVGLVCCYVGVYAGMVIFWAFAPHIISPKARPVGMAFISTVGMVASIVQYTIISFLRDLTNSWAAGLIYIAIMLLAATVLVLLVPANEKISADQAATPAKIAAPQA